MVSPVPRAETTSNFSTVGKAKREEPGIAGSTTLLNNPSQARAVTAAAG